MRVFIALSSLACLLLALACEPDQTRCGQGTVEQDGVCAPVDDVCGPGTVIQGDSCVPRCGVDQQWDGAACVPLAGCEAGTLYDQLSDACVLACPAGYHWDGQSCRSTPTCAPGTAFNPQTNACEVSAGACAEGSVLVDGVCAPDIGCGEGTRQEGNLCVPDTMLPADLYESPEPDGVQPFSLPSIGEQLLLGGTVDTPTDVNGDGYADPDWDAFSFEASAGTLIRLRATSAGAALPAFEIMSSQRDEDGYALLFRFALNPNGVEVEREVYLPRDDTYLVRVSDYVHVVADLYGEWPFPVGGDAFIYQVAVENLGSPDVIEVSSLPLVDSGAHTRGALAFYRLRGLEAGDLLTARALGEPAADVDSDVYPLITIIEEGAEVRAETYAYNTRDDATITMSVGEAQSYLVVQDYLVMTGPDAGFALSLEQEPVVDCTEVACAASPLAAGEHMIWRWDLSAHDLFLFNATVPPEAAENLRVAMYDRDMEVLTEASAGPTWNRWSRLYVEQPTWVYLWLEGWAGDAVPDFRLDAVHSPLPELQSGQALTGLSVLDLPEGTVEDAGLASFVGVAGQVAVVTHFAAGAGAWTNPRQELLTSSWLGIGPALDTVDPQLSPISPALALLRDDGHYLHSVGDDAAGLAGSSYDVTLQLLTPVDLGAPSPGGPVSASSQQLDAASGLALFRFGVTSGEAYTVTATPTATGLQPEVWLLGQGGHYQTTWSWNPEGWELGRKAVASAASAGDAVDLTFTADYDGDLLLLLRHASGSGAISTFDIEIAR